MHACIPSLTPACFTFPSIRTTLNDLLCSGDAIHAIVGLMSVSVGVVLTHVCEGGKTLSAAVAETYAARLFEEDPFLDLEVRNYCQPPPSV